MTQPSSQKGLKILGKHLSESIERAAVHLRNEFAQGQRYAWVGVDLADRRRLFLKVSKQETGTAAFGVEFDRDFAPCSACQRLIEEDIRRYEDTTDSIFFLREAVSAVQDCGCLLSTRQRQDEVTLPHVEPPVALARRVIKVSPSGGNAPVATRQHPAPDVVAREAPPRGVADAGDSVSYAPELSYELPPARKIAVTLNRDCVNALKAHCANSNLHNREVGGIIVGYVNEAEVPDGTSFQVTATDIVPFISDDSSHSHLRLDEEAWLTAGREIEAKYTVQRKSRLGWYHTHPTQGVFFSGQDFDTHAVFTQPHQFALVVDPQGMEAGLFYWQDHPNRRLSQPLRFKLSLPRSTAPATVRRREESTMPAAAPISVPRLLAFSTLAAGLAAYLVRKPVGSRLSPEDACLISMMVLFGLRLWNARAFQFNVGFETVAVRRVSKFLRAGSRQLVARLRALPPLVALSLLILFLLASGGLLYFASSGWPNRFSFWSGATQLKQTMQATLPAAITTPAGGENRPATQVKSIPLVLKENGTGRNVQLVLSSQTPAAQPTEVVYVTRLNRNEEEFFSPRPANAENLFFTKVIGQKFPDEAFVRALQGALNLPKPDGKWGATTRRALLSHARQNRGPLKVTLSNGTTLSIEFK